MSLPKGRTNNPNGRPALGQTIAPFLRSEGEVEQEIEINGEKRILPRKQILAMRIWKEALAGDYNFIKLLNDRLDGQAIQKIEADINNLSDLSKEDCEKIYAGFNETMSKEVIK